MPVQTGIQVSFPITKQRWIPECAGMTDEKAARVLKDVNGLRAAQKGECDLPLRPDPDFAPSRLCGRYFRLYFLADEMKTAVDVQ